MKQYVRDGDGISKIILLFCVDVNHLYFVHFKHTHMCEKSAIKNMHA